MKQRKDIFQFTTVIGILLAILFLLVSGQNHIVFAGITPTATTDAPAPTDTPVPPTDTPVAPTDTPIPTLPPTVTPVPTSSTLTPTAISPNPQPTNPSSSPTETAVEPTPNFPTEIPELGYGPPLPILASIILVVLSLVATIVYGAIQLIKKD